MLQADLLSSQSLIQTLRTLSLKGRQGVLDINGEEMSLEATLFDGKIVAVRRADEVPTMAVCSKLAKAGLLTVEVLQQVSDVELSFEELFGYLVRIDPQLAEAFLRAKYAYELDLLHGLLRMPDGVLSFTPKVVKVSEEFSASIYPGQLLLDLVELSGEEERYERFFAEVDPEEVPRLYRTGQPKHRFTGHEEALWQLLATEHDVAVLEHRSLLSRFHFLQAIMSFVDQGLVSLGSNDLDPEEILEGEQSLLETTSAELDEFQDLHLHEVQDGFSDAIAEADSEIVKSLPIKSPAPIRPVATSPVGEPAAVEAPQATAFATSEQARNRVFFATIGIFVMTLVVLLPGALSRLLLALEKLASLN